MSPARTTVRVRAALAAGAALATAATVIAVGGTAAAQSPRQGSSSTTNVTVATLPMTHLFTQKTPVNVVLLGYPGSLATGIRKQLPAHATPVVRATHGYAVPNARKVGLRFDYDYHFINAPKTFENRYFRYLRSIATKTVPTDYQVQYNHQKHNVVTVKGPVLNIPAVKAETWLERHSHTAFHIGPKSYTVFLVNWWGRKDFSFHVYRKVDAGSTDPDTGEKWGTHDSRAIMAWGGSTGRSWFYDLSAGPEAATKNWDVDHADIDGDSVRDTRMPPVWEYSNRGFRLPSQLAPDLGKVVRYVGLDLLFTSSPLYDPLIAAPAPGGDVNVPITMFEDNPKDRTGASKVDPTYSLAKWRGLLPYIDFTASTKNRNPIDAGAQDSFRLWAGLPTAGTSACWNQYQTTFAQLYCWADAHHSDYYPETAGSHNVGVFGFWTTEARMGSQKGLLGFADDNWSDGTQTYVFTFNDPTLYDLGYGYTETLTHEVGHHLGMSHPHDGYDPASGASFGTTGPSYFSWVGDESNTVMGYLDLSQSFGKFDMDNMSRFQTAGYDNWARALIAAAQAAPGKDSTTDTVVAHTQALLKQAESAFGGWQYVRAAGLARQAYEVIQAEATRIGAGKVMHLQTLSVPSSTVPHEGDPVRFPDN